MDQSIQEQRCCQADYQLIDKVMQLPCNRTAELTHYLCSYEYFIEYEKEIKDQFKFKVNFNFVASIHLNNLINKINGLMDATI